MTFDEVSRELVGDVTIIRVRGEVDVANARSVTQQAFSMCEYGRRIAVDLSTVTYLDSAGVRMIDAVARHCATLGAAFAVVVPSDSVIRRLVELTLPDVAIVDHIGELGGAAD